jgi:alpha-mannosidase
MSGSALPAHARLGFCCTEDGLAKLENSINRSWSFARESLLLKLQPSTPMQMNNYWDTNYRAGQGGAFTFRYVVTSADRLDPAALTRMGWESMQAVSLDHVIDQDKVGDPDKPLPPTGASFLDVSSPNVVLVTWKLGEDRKGTILRLAATAGQATDTSISLPLAPLHSANLCNEVEDDLGSLDVSGNRV